MVLTVCIYFFSSENNLFTWFNTRLKLDCFRFFYNLRPVCVENYTKYRIAHITNIFKIFDYLFVSLLNLLYLNIINNFI